MAQTKGAISSTVNDGLGGIGRRIVTREVVLSELFALPTTSDDAKVFPFHRYSGGMIYVDGACAITWYVADTLSGDVKAAFDDAGTPAAIEQSPGGEGWYVIPPKLFGAAFIAPVIASGSVNAKLMLKR